MTTKYLIDQLIGQVGLNLEGLTIYTEVASGHYMISPILAAKGGATRVIAQVNDSRYGAATEIISQAGDVAQDFGVLEKIDFVIGRNHAGLAQADIVTNSGHVRPIDKDLIGTLKSTAVIPLMWETWEFREEDFDLEFCKERGILALGSKEQGPPCDMRLYLALTALKQLLATGYDGGKVLLLGNSPFPGRSLFESFSRMDLDTTWVSDDELATLSYNELREHFLELGHQYSHLLVAEHLNPRLLLGALGILSGDLMHSVNPDLRIAVMCGNVDGADLKKHQLVVFPESLASFGFMSYQPYELGSRPVLNLYAMGLKVGEQMARARLDGFSAIDAAKFVCIQGLAMDFIGEKSWMKT